jgi:hypothetical protein
MKFTVTRTAEEQGMKPPRFHGFAYTDYERDQRIYWLIPFNFIAKFLRYLKYKWIDFLYTDKLWYLENEIYYIGYRKGYTDGEESIRYSGPWQDH